MTAACAPEAPAAPAAGERLIAVVGNPNVGKSSLFNALTGLRQRVANYAGVTVDAMEGRAALAGTVARVVDLPGTYSLVPTSADEAIVERVLLGEAPDGQPVAGLARPDVVLAVLDATNLRRNLFLLSEVLDLGRPTVVALNMVDEARRGGLEVPTKRLQELTGCPVIETVATTGEGLDALRAALERAGPAETPAAREWRFGDEPREQLLEAARGATAWDRLRGLRAADAGLRQAEVTGRWAWVGKALGAPPASSTLRARTDAIDGWLLHPVLGPLFFLLTMALVFQSVFAGAEPVMKLIEEGLVGGLKGLVEARVASPGLRDFLTRGVLDGVGAVIVFLPQILILFFFLSLLEDTGYMARAAFIVDRPLKALGLSGRSFIPLLSSFACAIPGVLATRTIPSRTERLLTILLAPLMTCSARLPVYTLLIAACIPATKVGGVLSLQGLVLFGLYVMGLATATLLALVVGKLRRTRGKELPLVVELPPYRRPALRGLLTKLKLRGGDFLKRAGTTIFVVALVLWFLSTYPARPAAPGERPEEAIAAQREASYAGQLGKAIEPVIAPLGFDWKIGVGLVASFAAREVFVATMGVVYSVGEGADEENDTLRERLQHETYPAGHARAGQKVFTLPAALALLAFYVIALQCGATVAVVRREAGSWRFALGQLALFLVLAWLAAFATYRGALALGL